MHRSTIALAAGTMLALTAIAGPHAAADPAPDLAAEGIGVGAGLDAASTSPFYAGFSKTGVGAAETSAVFRVPELTCTTTDEGFVITVWAISEDGEFLAGPDLFVYCSEGEFVLDGHVTTSGGQIPIWQTLVPGDEVKMAITEHAEGTSTHDISFSSITRGWTSLLPTNSPVDRIEITHRRMSLGGVSIPPPDYGRFRFRDVVFDGVPLGTADATRTKLVDAKGEVLINARRAGEAGFKLISKVG